MSERRQRMEQRLRAALAPEALEIVDESHLHAGHEGAKSGGGHYAVTIVSPQFKGLDMLKRHRLVYEALGDMMLRDIHALSVRAFTPDEF